MYILSAYLNHFKINLKYYVDKLSFAQNSFSNAVIYWIVWKLKYNSIIPIYVKASDMKKVVT